jgi:hypothetical protein
LYFTPVERHGRKERLATRMSSAAFLLIGSLFEQRSRSRAGGPVGERLTTLLNFSQPRT